MRWQAVLCIALSSIALARGQEGAEGLQGVIRAGDSHAQAPANTNTNTNNNNAAAKGVQQVAAAVDKDKDKDKDKPAKPAPKASEPHEAPKNNAPHDAKPAPAKDVVAQQGNKPRAAPNPNSASKDHDKKPSKTRKESDDNDEDDEDDEEDDDAENEYMRRARADKAAGKMPGRVKMVVPPRTVHTPLFELDSVVELQWEFDNNVIEVPDKLMLSVQLPKDPHNLAAKPVLYDIAVNITGDKKKFFWDTKNDVPEGIGMREGNGYTLFIYDADIGFRMSDVVPAGYLLKHAMPFAFYISRYERTNDGVPKGYNPNAAGGRPAPALGLTAVLLLIVFAVLHTWSG
ncbi:hypothetical protein LPJ66_000371 [Kickxella alabastrina]|uniref:Uncharacterized protein n=1 Tax=Kickxella alabastrina TaxID=61397 RepID=A0ACC1IWB1_9FUNG|nr:hypothetical protein LPJ66_000371 [Kickxella alabastrina]